MSKYYFFTESDLLLKQSSSETYGVVNNSTKDEYVLCSTHKASISSTAFAICDGILCVQQNIDNPDYVNLVIKPTVRPNINIGYIKYFIYRNVLKSTIISGNHIKNFGSDLTSSLYDTQALLNIIEDEKKGVQIGTTQTLPNISTIGYDISENILGNDKEIDLLFYEESEERVLPSIQGGWSLGMFSANSFSIEIILDSVKSTPLMQNLREGNHTFKIDKLQQNQTSIQIRDHWLKKEYILDYIDPAAFFGSFYNSGLMVKKSNTTFERKKKEELYDEVLAKFFNSDVIYIDIRNEHNRSFNFYNNYSDDIKIGFNTSTNLNLINFYSQKWPIITFNTISFPTNNTFEKNSIYLSLAKGDNTTPLFFLSQGLWDNGEPEDKLPKRFKDEGLFKAVKFNDLDYTEPLGLAIPNIKERGATTIVASYIKLKYLKQSDLKTYPRQTSGTTIFQSNHFLDNLFPIFDMKTPYHSHIIGDNKIINRVYYEEVLTTDTINLKYQAINAIGIAIDKSNITFFLFPMHRRYQSRFAKFDIPTQRIDGKGNFLSYIPTLSNSMAYLRKSEFEYQNSSNVPYATINQIAQGRTLFSNDFNEFFHLTISRIEYDNLVQLKNNSNFSLNYPIYLGVIFDSEHWDDKKHKYITYEIVLRGYGQNSLTIIEIPTSIKINNYVQV